MNTEAQFHKLIHNHDNKILDYFLSLSEEEKQKLASCYSTKKDFQALCDIANKYYLIHWQIEIIALYFLDRKTHNKWFGRIPNEYYAHKIYKVFQPNWLTSALQEEKEQNQLSYDNLIDLSEQGLQFPDALWLRKLVNVPNLFHDLPHQFYTDYFWLLFTHESSIFWSDKNSLVTWKMAIKKLCQEGLIDRQKVLSASLKATAQNFNKLSSGWFSDLYVAMEPTTEEHLSLQTELLLSLHSQHTKPVNATLKILKTLVQSPDFKPIPLLENIENLLVSETKSIVKSGIAVLVNLAKTHKQQLSRICSVMSTAFICTDENIQTQVATFIVKHANSIDKQTHTQIEENISACFEDLFSSVKTQVTHFLSASTLADLLVNDTNKPSEAPYAESINPILDDKNTIERYETASLDEQLFFITQAFENNEPYDFDRYCSVMPLFIKKMFEASAGSDAHTQLMSISKYVDKLTPALHNALRAMQFNNNSGCIEYLMATHFLNILDVFIQHLGTAYAPSVLIEKYVAVEKSIVKYTYNPVVRNASELFEQGICAYTQPLETLQLINPALMIYNLLLIHNKQLVTKQLAYLSELTKQASTNTSELTELQITALPMLSTPTHAPCFIDGSAFISRLIAYQNANQPVDITDFQIAITRLAWQKETTANTSELTQPFANIIKYLQTESLTAVDMMADNDTTHLSYWLSAVYRKALKNHCYEELKQFIQTFNLPHAYLYQPRQWETQKLPCSYRPDLIYTHLLIDGYNKQQVPTQPSEYRFYMDWLWQKDNDNKKRTYGSYRAEMFHYIVDHEQAKLCMLSPFDPSIIATEIARHSRKGFTTTSEQLRIKNMMTFFMSTWRFGFADGCYLYVPATMLAEKHNGQLVCEFWLKMVAEHRLDNQRFGQSLGKLYFAEFAPLKRFTDLLSQQLMNVSARHNQELITLISYMLPAMNDEAIKGTKKLLELYLEILTVTKSKLTDIDNTEQVQEKLEKWTQTKSLKAIIKKLITL